MGAVRGAEGLADVRRVEARIKFLLARKPPIQHIWPLTQLLRPWSTASSAHHASCEYYRRVKGGVTQYVVVKLAGALVAFVLKPLNLWGEGSLDPLTGFFWVANATNLSQGWALYWVTSEWSPRGIETAIRVAERLGLQVVFTSR